MHDTPSDASILDDSLQHDVWERFQRLLERARVPQHQRTHHERWVRRWIEGLHGGGVPRDAVARYARDLVNEGVAEWQARQAARSLECWLQARQEILDERSSSTSEAPPQDWPSVLLEMERMLRVQQYSPRTAEAYLYWVRQLVFRADSFPRDGDQASKLANSFLRELALARNLSPASINQARNALAWLFGRFLGYELVLDDRGTAHRWKRIPHVISSSQVRKLLDACPSPWDLFFGLQYGCGLRLMELLELRVQDIDLDRSILTIRHGKGGQDRQALLPRLLQGALARHLEQRRAQWLSDFDDGFAAVDLPNPLGGKTRSTTDWRWQHVFGALRPLRHPESGELRRWRPLEIVVRSELREAAQRVGIVGRVHPHLLRHCFATHLLEAGVSIQQIQMQLGHARLQTTLIYLHVKSPIDQARSPLDLEPR